MTASLLQSLCAERLLWLPDLGIGYYPVTETPYNAEYWLKYRAYDRTPMGDRLTAARVALVGKYLRPDSAGRKRLLVDVGIGGGRFVEEMGCFGHDVNPAAVNWLRERGCALDPWAGQVPALTFWDSLEHIHDPVPLLRNAREWVFVSCPVFENVGHIRRSKHFRTDEHCWYFTRMGLVELMKAHGFGLIEFNTMEEEAGREDIGTFVFKRVA